MRSDDLRPHSRLPSDPAYWDDLAARSVRAVFGVRAAQTWWRPFADSAFALAASALLVLLGGALALGDRPERDPSAPTAAITESLAPRDPLLNALMGEAAPPEGAALLRLVALREEDR
jgi:hypothetical protein